MSNKKILRAKEDGQNWEKVAPEYIKFISHQKAYLKHLIYESLFSNIIHLVSPIKGKRILDAGCGEGRLARLLSQRGGLVSGCDVSPSMVDAAKKTEEKNRQRIKYFSHNLVNPFSSVGLFDTVVANLVLFNIFDLGAVIRNLSAIIAPGGKFVFSIEHPCFNNTKSQWYNLRFIGFGGGKIIFDIDRSYKEAHDFKMDYRFKPGLINYYHRPIETYIHELRKNGFVVNELLEPTLNLDQIFDNQTYHHHYLPKFLLIGATKT